MSAANKAKGTRFESELADYLQSQGIDAKRLPRTGVKDIGDVSFPLFTAFTSTQHMVVEAKNRAKMDLPTYLAEASTEADNYEAKYPAVHAAHPMVVVKRRGKGVKNSYVVFDLDDFVHFLHTVGVL